jgi:hypothetical protein
VTTVTLASIMILWRVPPSITYILLPLRISAHIRQLQKIYIKRKRFTYKNKQQNSLNCTNNKKTHVIIAELLVVNMLWRVRVAPLINCGFWITWIDLLENSLTLGTILSYHKYTIVIAHSQLQHCPRTDFSSWLLPQDWLLSLSYITTDGQSASLSWYQAPIWGLRPDFY